MMLLSRSQQLAQYAVRRAAIANREVAEERVRAVLPEGETQASGSCLAAALALAGRLTINFHPDRPLADGSLVLERLAVEGVLRSQFETHISNGGLTAVAGGDRDRWEGNLFGSAYGGQGPDAAWQRPKYGGLDLAMAADGACPRFGSCFFILHDEVRERTTLSVGDSVSEPTDVGTQGELMAVLAGCLERAVERPREDRRAIGGLSLRELLGLLASAGESTENTLAGRHSSPEFGRSMDDYIEAQIHGPLKLKRDVEGLVADPSFQNTAVGEGLRALAHSYSLRLEWHPGLCLAPEAIPLAFRHPSIPDFAGFVLERFAPGEAFLRAATLGSLAQEILESPEKLVRWGDSTELLTRLKHLWHAIVVFGQVPR